LDEIKYILVGSFEGKIGGKGWEGGESWMKLIEKVKLLLRNSNCIGLLFSLDLPRRSG
jgi:hypothetical protein